MRTPKTPLRASSAMWTLAIQCMDPHSGHLHSVHRAECQQHGCDHRMLISPPASDHGGRSGYGHQRLDLAQEEFPFTGCRCFGRSDHLGCISLTPLSDAQSELLARTRPNILDVFIAFLGLAGILAGSRKEKSNVVPGVAIATALDAALVHCGLWDRHGPVGIRLWCLLPLPDQQHFHQHRHLSRACVAWFSAGGFLDPAKERRARRYITGFALVTIVPAIWVFLLTVKETLFLRSADQYVQEIVDHPEPRS